MFICTLYAVIEPATELLNKMRDVNKVLGKYLFTSKKIIHLIPLLAFWLRPIWTVPFAPVK